MTWPFGSYAVQTFSGEMPVGFIYNFSEATNSRYHLVRITKYRKPVPQWHAAIRLWDLIRELCKHVDVEIIKEHVSDDHSHIMVVAPLHLSDNDFGVDYPVAFSLFR